MNLLVKMKNTEGTIMFLKLIKSVLIAYVHENSSTRQRIFNAVFVVQFIRIWRQWIANNDISVKHFITQNAWEGLELNLILLLKLALEGKCSYIYLHNSQINESFFRLMRSYTGAENMVSNVSIKSFIHRVHKIELEEQLMTELSDFGLNFPKLVSRQKTQPKESETLTRLQIETIAKDAMNYAINEAKSVGMSVHKISLKMFLKPVTNVTCDAANVESESDDDFLGVQSVQNVETFLSDDEQQAETLDDFQLQDMTMLNESSGNYLIEICRILLNFT